VTAMSGGALGSLVGIIAVACPVCPAILLGWLGLAAAIQGLYWPDLGLNSASLILLVLALNLATGARRMVRA
jgi:hypothetical protein